MSFWHALLHLLGWLLFVVCAVLFLIAGIRDGDPLLSVGSALFLIACVLFIIPTIAELRRSESER